MESGFSGEVDNGREVIFEGLEVLEKDQNLFDQPPYTDLFQDILTRAQSLTKEGLSQPTLDEIRILFSSLLKQPPYSHKAELSPTELLQDFLKSPRFDELFSVKMSQSKLINVGNALRQVLPAAMDNFPYLGEYISESLSIEYGLNGQIKNYPQSKYEPKPAKGYGPWLIKRKEKDKRLENLMIQEITDEMSSQDDQGAVKTNAGERVKRHFRLQVFSKF